MKILKRILIVIVLLIAAAAIIGLFLPSQVHVEKSLTMNAKPATVFNYVNNITKYNEWSPWHQKDTTALYTYEGPGSGVGATMTWDGKHWQVGQGLQRTVEVVPNELIKRELYFRKDEKPSYGTLKFEADGVGTKVTWMLDSDMGGNPFMRLMGLMMGMVGKEFEKGLAMMKANVERLPDEVTADYKIEMTTVDAAHYLAIRDTASIPTIGQKMGEYFGLIQEAMKKQNLNFAGPPFAIYYSDSETNWDMETAIPVDRPGKADGTVQPGERKAGNAVVAHYFGAYESMAPVYATLTAYIAANSKKIIGAPWEVYVISPTTEKDTAKWQTDVYFPVE